MIRRARPGCFLRRRAGAAHAYFIHGHFSFSIHDATAMLIVFLITDHLAEFTDFQSPAMIIRGKRLTLPSLLRTPVQHPQGSARPHVQKKIVGMTPNEYRESLPREIISRCQADYLPCDCPGLRYGRLKRNGIPAFFSASCH